MNANTTYLTCPNGGRLGKICNTKYFWNPDLASVWGSLYKISPSLLSINGWGQNIEEGLNKKTRQRSSRRIGGQNPCCSSFFATVFLKQTVEHNRLFQKHQGKTASAARRTVELNRLIQKDRVKTACAARMLSPNPMRRPLPCLLIQSFFYGA